MADQIEHGGPAFPTENSRQTGHSTWHYEGMTLRDYFAAKWLQGWMANPNTGDADRESAAIWAYEMADAMLKARGQQ